MTNNKVVQQVVEIFIIHKMLNVKKAVMKVKLQWFKQLMKYKSINV